ncbi:MAG: Nramp family divalent metal transporter, partial [Candidatus Eremiobacteraeota bacterium]|nr:Nramp family divalent metal transporter [Candidatus Eremiobacteraeota bacterium]
MQQVSKTPKRRWWRSLLLFAGVLGPGFITASAGNDVGGIATYSAAGAQYGYAILWVLLPLAVALIVVQEMAARMGTVTGKGLASLIRENFGVRVSFFAMLALFVVNVGLTATEFAGIATASEIFGISRYIAVPIALVAVFFFILKFDNKIVERTFVGFSLIYISYAISAILAHPDWHAVAYGALVPTFHATDKQWMFLVVGLIGTTVSPYMQFFLQSAVVEKGTGEEHLGLARADVVVGSVIGIGIAGFMIVSNAATIFVANHHGGHIHPTQASDFAVALKPLAGTLAATIFALGILNAGLFTATVLPLSTAYVICEALGFEAALDRKFAEAPFFFTLFGAGLILGAILVLIPSIPLLPLILVAQTIQGVLLPAELVLMLIIINRKSIMGAYTNSRFANAIAWATAIVVGGLSLVFIVQQL